jgi:hypothetical protein
MAVIREAVASSVKGVICDVDWCWAPFTGGGRSSGGPVAHRGLGKIVIVTSKPATHNFTTTATNSR